MNRSKQTEQTETVRRAWGKQNIVSDDLPQSACLKPMAVFNGLYPVDEEEAEAYWDFISWAINQEHDALTIIPKPKSDDDFWQLHFAELIAPESAFNTVDFQRQHTFNFDRYGYRLKKVYEKVQDLAVMHSVITNEACRLNVQLRYRALVDREFRGQVLRLVEIFKKCSDAYRRGRIMADIGQLNKRILICKSIWQKHADQP